MASSPQLAGDPGRCDITTWLNDLHFPLPAAQVVFDDYRTTVRAAEDRVRRLEVELRRCAANSRQVALIAALQALRGVGFLTAVTIVTEPVIFAASRRLAA